MCTTANVDVAMCEPYVELLHALEPAEATCEAALDGAADGTDAQRNQALRSGLKSVVDVALAARAQPSVRSCASSRTRSAPSGNT